MTLLGIVDRRVADHARRMWRYTQQVRHSLAFGVLVIVTVCMGIRAVYLLWNQAYVDDAAITFQYARQLVDGNGIVYNTGEYVEGYSNFGFMLAIAVGMIVGFDPYVVSQILGALGLVGVVVISLDAARRVFLPAKPTLLMSGGYLLLIPVMMPSFVSMALSGLETTCYACAIVTFGYACFLRQDVSERAQWICVNVSALAMLWLRMESALMIVVAVLLYMHQQARIRRRASHALARTVIHFGGAGIVYVCYLAWKVMYYGDIFPNTYYAKLGYLSRWSLGQVYWFQVLQGYEHIWWLLVPFLLVGALISLRCLMRGNERRVDLYFFAYLAFSCLLYFFYVMKVGGDFMEYRFFYHILPAALLVTWFGFANLMGAWRGCVAWVSGAVLFVLLVNYTETPHVPQGAQLQSIEHMHTMAIDGKKIGEALRAHLPEQSVLATTLAGTIRYHSGLTTIDQWGLNDHEVAHQEFYFEGTRGHSKPASIDYMRRRGVHFVLDHPRVCSCKRPCHGGQPTAFVRIDSDRCVRMSFLSYDSNILEALAASPDVLTHGLPPTRPALIASLARLSATTDASTTVEMVRSVRWARALFPDEPKLVEGLKPRIAYHWTFEGDTFPTGWRVTSGTAFGDRPTHGSIGRQTRVEGIISHGLLNSFHGGDPAYGRIESPTFILPHGGVHLLVGGGADCSQVYVALMLGTHVVAKACGKNSELLRPVVLNAPIHRGKAVKLVVVDQRDRAWGHILLDDVIIPKSMPVTRPLHGSTTSSGGAPDKILHSHD